MYTYIYPCVYINRYIHYIIIFQDNQVWFIWLKKYIDIDIDMCIYIYIFYIYIYSICIYIYIFHLYIVLLEYLCCTWHVPIDLLRSCHRPQVFDSMPQWDVRSRQPGLSEASRSAAVSPSINIWLVVWNINFIFPYIGLLIIPIDELIFFRGVAKKPPTRLIDGDGDVKMIPFLDPKIHKMMDITKSVLGHLGKPDWDAGWWPMMAHRNIMSCWDGKVT